MESVGEIGHDSREVRDSSSEDLCDEGSVGSSDVSGTEECSSSSISEPLSSVSGVESDSEDQEQSQHGDAPPLFPQAHVSTEEFDVAFLFNCSTMSK
jgi:hypothetical protein